MQCYRFGLLFLHSIPLFFPLVHGVRNGLVSFRFIRIWQRISIAAWVGTKKKQTTAFAMITINHGHFSISYIVFLVFIVDNWNRSNIRHALEIKHCDATTKIYFPRRFVSFSVNINRLIHVMGTDRKALIAMRLYCFFASIHHNMLQPLTIYVQFITASKRHSHTATYTDTGIG